MTSTNRPCVAIVEDDPDSREALHVILEGLGYQVVSFASGKEALGKIPGKSISLFMLDIMMPEMNGYELLQEIRKIPEFTSTPIIMVTAKDEDQEVLEGYQFGADYYITKPYTSKQIEYGIKLYLDSSTRDDDTLQ